MCTTRNGGVLQSGMIVLCQWWARVGDVKVRQFGNQADDCFEWQRDCCGGAAIRSRKREIGWRDCGLAPRALIVGVSEASVIMTVGGGAEG
jgi:hypothetical protein